MKTIRINKKHLPGPLRFMLLMLVIAVVCLPNWIALEADNPPEDARNQVSTLDLLTEEEEEPELKVEDWMISFEGFGLVAEIVEEEIPLENWMLEFGNVPKMADLPQEVSRVEDLNLKPCKDVWFNDFIELGFRGSGSRYR